MPISRQAQKFYRTLQNFSLREKRSYKKYRTTGRSSEADLSPFGMRRSPFTGNWAMHQGVDISWWPGAPIRASADGQVVFSGMKGGYGRTIQIQHEYGFQTLYAHLSSISAYEGKQVKKGEIIGFLGRTGRSTGFHLHYEVRIGTKAVDPMIFMTTEF